VEDTLYIIASRCHFCPNQVTLWIRLAALQWANVENIDTEIVRFNIAVSELHSVVSVRRNLKNISFREHSQEEPLQHGLLTSYFRYLVAEIRGYASIQEQSVQQVISRTCYRKQDDIRGPKLIIAYVFVTHSCGEYAGEGPHFATVLLVFRRERVR
jgi:hypothetical protein